MGEIVPLLPRDERFVRPVYARDFPRPLAVDPVEVRWIPGLDAPVLGLVDAVHELVMALVPW